MPIGRTKAALEAEVVPLFGSASHAPISDRIVCGVKLRWNNSACEDDVGWRMIVRKVMRRLILHGGRDLLLRFILNLA